MAQQMISQHQCQHRFGNRYSANAHAWIMTTLGNNIGFIAMNIDRWSGCENG